MKKWYSFLEVLKFPLIILFMSWLFYGVGNLITNPAFAPLYVIENEIILAFAYAIMRLATFFIVSFPLIALLRLCSKRVNGINSILTGLIGYVTFLVFTIYFGNPNLPNYAYSAIMGISVTNSSLAHLAGATRYPLQTGLIGVVVIMLVTRLALKQSKNRLTNGFFGYIDKDVTAIILTVIYSALVGIGFGIVWPQLIQEFQELVNFIATGSSNPVNLSIYGVVDRLFSTLNLSNLLRNSFWFKSAGGSIMNMVGESVMGDVNIWSAVVNSGAISTQAGKFITPYYVLNIFAIPGMLIAIYTLNTDKLARRKNQTFFLLAILVSIFTGTLVPLELILLLLCPLLYVLHILYSGLLFGLFQILEVYLGYQTTSTNVVTATPGTLMELLTYAQNTQFRQDIMMILIVGVISFFVYLIFTRFYFDYLAFDIFSTGKTRQVAVDMVDAFGGSGNIKMIYSSINNITIQVFDPMLISVDKIKRCGVVKLYENKAGFVVDYGSGSRIVGKAMNKELREAIRKV